MAATVPTTPITIPAISPGLRPLLLLTLVASGDELGDADSGLLAIAVVDVFVIVFADIGVLARRGVVVPERLSVERGATVDVGAA